MLELMTALWQPGWTEFDGEFYQTPRLEMTPTPPRVPIFVGGLSDVALRRAARHDGWSRGHDQHGPGAGRGHPAARTACRKRLSMDDFTILTPLVDAMSIADYERAEAGGITHVLTMPWMFYSGPDATLAEKIDDMTKFRRDLALD